MRGLIIIPINQTSVQPFRIAAESLARDDCDLIVACDVVFLAQVEIVCLALLDLLIAARIVSQ